MIETNPTPSKVIKNRHRKEGKGMTLRQFARELASQKDEVAKAWWTNKSGLLERKAKAERQKNKGARIAMEKMATKAARQKRKSKGAPAKEAPATIRTKATPKA